MNPFNIFKKKTPTEAEIAIRKEKFDKEQKLILKIVSMISSGKGVVEWCGTCCIWAYGDFVLKIFTEHYNIKCKNKIMLTKAGCWNFLGTIDASSIADIIQHRKFNQDISNKKEENCEVILNYLEYCQ
jgi:hypothetical protein